MKERSIYSSRGRAATPHRAHGEGTLHAKDAHGSYKAKRAPGRNDLCPCKSGKKWKRCHGDAATQGEAVVQRIMDSGACDACDASGVRVIPLKHTGLGSWVAHVCLPCIRGGLDETLERLLPKTPTAPQGSPHA
jgi:hypothetical protein